MVDVAGSLLSIGRTISLFKVETEAGTHFFGQSKAPEAVLESGGLQRRLGALGYDTLTFNTLGSDEETRTLARWQPAPKINGVRNEANTVKVMHAAHDALIRQLSASKAFPIVVGGDCSITPAVLSAFWATQPADIKVGLMYMDGDADLTLPSQTEADGSSATLDAMTMTHLTGRHGGLESMRAFTRPDGHSLVDASNIVLFGFEPLQPATEHWVYLLEKGF